MSQPRTSGGENGERYASLTGPLQQRGAQCTVEWGLSDFYVHAQLPDGHALVISPPQEPAAPHPPSAWLVTLHTDDQAFVRVVYDSGDTGPDHGDAGDVTALLAALDQVLDQHALPPRSPAEPDVAIADHPFHGVLAATSDPDRGALAILATHSWQPVPRFDVYRQRPGTGRTEALQRVAATVTALQRAGFTVAVAPALAREAAARRRLDPTNSSALSPPSPPGGMPLTSVARRQGR
ncbi:hypothetical protein [Streptacidiphilus sp. MAP5-52]|uniref:hypothetical protein n=1 Tax=Streptacidiphilus sp. MAP5-52 TaxID=3156267 RepID=UPI003519BF31